MSASPGHLLVDARPVDHPTARQRGIGRYVAGLLGGLDEIDAPFTALVGSPAEAEFLSDVIRPERVRPWSPAAVREVATPGTWYLATQLLLHPVALDPIPRTVTAARLPVVALMYDVIPYRYPHRYQNRELDRRLVELRATLARTTDAMLAISEFSAGTAADELSYPRERIASIGAGADDRFRPLDERELPWPDRVLATDVGPYVISVVGADERKNTQRLLSAWSHLPAGVRSSHRLVLVAAHTPRLLGEWERMAERAGIAGDVVFTGAVTDQEMVALLQRARLAVMASTDEGFGLPVLEAVACGCPAICSSVSALPEVLQEPTACFDPYDERAIASAIARGLTDDGHRATLHRAGRGAVDRWTWPAVARSAVEALTELGPRWHGTPRRTARSIGLVARDTPWLEEMVAPEGGRIVRFVDTSDTTDPLHGGPDRWPGRAVDHYVKPWEVDDLVVVDPSGEPGSVGEVSARVSVHLWLRAPSPTVLQSRSPSIGRARSVIVSTDQAAELVRTSHPGGPPVLILPTAPEPADDVSSASSWSPATAMACLFDWLERVGDLPRDTVERMGPASP